MLCFSKAKFNLGLRILRKRSDGYHDIESIIVPLNWNDAIEIISDENIRETTFHFHGLKIPGIHENHNLKKVLDLLKIQYNFQIPPSEIRVLKNIPAGAGLGGGSGNATAFLNLLCEKFSLDLSFEQKFNLLESVGSDCLFFLYDKPCLVQGKGDQIKPIEIPQLSDYYIFTIWPGIHSDTSKAYNNCKPVDTGKSLVEFIDLPINDWKNHIFNEFEKSVFNDYPILQELKQKMYNLGAIYASLSGSGSSIYGLFKNKPNIEIFEFANNYRYYLGKL